VRRDATQGAKFGGSLDAQDVYASGIVDGYMFVENGFSIESKYAAISHTHGNITNDGKVGVTAGLPLKTGTAGAVEAGAFGTGAGEFAEGNHTHGNLTNDGKVGTTANLPLKTGTNGVIEAGSFGTAAGQFAEGNHVHAAADITSGTLDLARLPVGTGSTQVAAGDHTHVVADVTGAAASGSITSSGLTQATARILGRTTASTGAVEELSASDVRSFLNVADGAEVNVQADWTQSNNAADDFIKNKPSLAASATTDTTNASNISSGTLAVARMGSGTPSASNFLRGDGSWQTVAAGVSGSTGSTDNSILRSDGTGGSTLQDSAFVIADNATASPNNTVNHASIQATGATTNVSVSIVPKGVGAFMLQVPNAAAGGGNVRGDSAVDLQSSRSAATQVASATRSVICGGGNNTASSQEACVLGGTGNNASGFQSAILGGRSNTASSDRAIAAGDGNTSNGTTSLALGVGNTSSSTASLAIGVQSRADRLSLFSHASGSFASAGDAQTIRAVLRCTTSNATATELFLDGTSSRLTIPTNKIMAGIISIVGTKTDGAAVAHYVRQFCVKNVTGTSSAVYTAAVIGTDNAAGTSITFNNPDTNGDALSVSVTGIASENWRWVASVDAVEILRT